MQERQGCSKKIEPNPGSSLRARTVGIVGLHRDVELLHVVDERPVENRLPAGLVRRDHRLGVVAQEHPGRALPALQRVGHRDAGAGGVLPRNELGVDQVARGPREHGHGVVPFSSFGGDGAERVAAAVDRRRVAVPARSRISLQSVSFALQT